MSKMLTVFTICVVGLVAGKLPEKLDVDTAPWCLASCGKDEAFDALGRFVATPEDVLEMPEAQIAQKKVFAATCGPDPMTTIAELFQQSGQIIQELSASRKMKKIFARRSSRSVSRLQSKIQDQTQAILSTVADIKKRLATQTVKMSRGLLPVAQRAASATFSMEKMTEKIFGITSTGVPSAKELDFDKISEKELESVKSSMHVLTRLCASNNVAKLLVIINIMKAGETFMPLCHSKVLFALTLRSLEIEWKKLKSEVKSARPLSYREKREIYNFYAEAKMLMDIDLGTFFAEAIIEDKMMS